MPLASPGDLPEALLHRLLHAGGRSSRRVCRQWRATYGPLRCGLRLTDPACSGDLPPQPSSIRALVLAASSLPPPPSPARPPNPHAIPAALPRAFPRLASLDLDTTLLSSPRARHPPLTLCFKSLAPLHPHLTALTLRNVVLADQPITALPAALPALRSLTLTPSSTDLGPDDLGLTHGIQLALATLCTLSNLQHLALPMPPHLAWRHPPPHFPRSLSSTHLPLLAALPPTLTHLDFQPCHLDPDHTPQDLHPFHAALPSLRTLHLSLDLSDRPPLASSLDTLAAALSQRQALTSLHLSLAFCTLPSDPAVARLARLRSRLRSLHLILTHDEVDAAAVLERLAPSLATMAALTSLTLTAAVSYDASPRLVQALATLWGGLAPTLRHLKWAQDFPRHAIVAALAPLTALQSLSLPPFQERCYNHDYRSDVAAEALLTLTRLTRLVACGCPEFASHLLAGIGRLPVLRQLVVTPASNTQALSGLASASSTLTRLELHCGAGSSAICMLRAAGAAPPSVRCLALLGVSCGMGCELARHLQQQDARGLLPLPRGLRVLALGAGTLRALSEQEVPVALEAAARRQDCALVAELPREERHFGCNGYL